MLRRVCKICGGDHTPAKCSTRMSDEELKHQLLQVLKQLQMDLELLHKTHVTRGLDISDPYTVNTKNLMLLQYAKQSLEAFTTRGGSQ